MMPPVAVLDACVLYSASLRDLFMWLALAGVYFPKWTEEIHEEWIRNVLEGVEKVSFRQPPHHNVDHGDINHRFAAFGQVLVAPH